MVTQTADRADGRTDGRTEGSVEVRTEAQSVQSGRKAAEETSRRTALFHFAATPSVTTRPLMYLQTTALLYDIVNAVYTKMYFYGSCEKNVYI